tara:strand:+ start:469 stop:1461 length:993 start_codon:yes stop_codon:yes gene_type:complete
MDIKVKKFKNGLIIHPGLSEEIGQNIQGPSLIKTPDWISNKLAKYYLYFADHKGDHIKLAYSDNLLGPWKILNGGTLQLHQSEFLTHKPIIPNNYDLNKMGISQPDGYNPEKLQTQYIPSRLDDMTIPHIASPDVHTDDINKKIVMYYHGLEKFGFQLTRVATSDDGINFKAEKKTIGRSYFRRFEYKNKTFGMSMPGVFYENSGNISEYTEITTLFDNNMRHSALIVINDLLHVFYSNVGDIPERIYLSTINISKPYNEWEESNPIEVIRPVFEWEGATLPLESSSRSAINIPVNQIRDPAIFVENENIYILYSVRGENGIGICSIEFI